MVSSLKRPTVLSGRRRHGDFRFGIEEEYFLADAKTMMAAAETPDALFEKLNSSGASLDREMLQAQLEVASKPHSNPAAARDELRGLRDAASAAAREYGLVVMACGTLPLGRWREAVQSPKKRYDQLMEGLQMLGQRNMLCGTHVHVELPDPSRRVEIMGRMLPYVPLLMALATSSPFWEGRSTGLKGYRLAAYDELPRTGFPDLFTNENDYNIYVQAMIRAGAITDASHVWWSLRPSKHYPTLELRAPDSCTRLDDTIAIASLYRAIVRHLYINPEVNRGFNVVDRALALENKWRAQRFGIGASFVTRDGGVPIAAYYDDLCSRLSADIDALGCWDEVDHCRTIIADGSAADAQLRVFRRFEGQGTPAALQAVSRWIADATVTRMRRRSLCVDGLPIAARPLSSATT